MATVTHHRPTHSCQDEDYCCGYGQECGEGSDECGHRFACDENAACPITRSFCEASSDLPDNCNCGDCGYSACGDCDCDYYGDDSCCTMDRESPGGVGVQLSALEASRCFCWCHSALRAAPSPDRPAPASTPDDDWEHYYYDWDNGELRQGGRDRRTAPRHNSCCLPRLTHHRALPHARARISA